MEVANISNSPLEAYFGIGSIHFGGPMQCYLILVANDYQTISFVGSTQPVLRELDDLEPF